MIRLLAVDMDGTLLNPQGKISARNTMALKLILKEGGGVVVCTGRGYDDAREPLEEAGIVCDLICMNGSAVYSRDGRQIHKQTLDEDQVRRVLCCAKDEPVVFDFMTDQGSCTVNTPDELQRCYEEHIFFPSADVAPNQFHERFRYLTKDELFSRGLNFYKISVISGAAGVLERIKRRLKREEAFSVASSSHTNLEITHPAAKKGGALLEYAGCRGYLPAEIMAVGDSENDLSMLSLKLGATVAMENAVEAVRLTAGHITGSNTEDGVAQAVEMFMLGRRMTMG